MARRVAVVVGVLAALLAVGFLVPVPSAVEVRAWAEAAGWAAPVLFLAVYSALAVAPIPRTVFNLSAGLLLGEALGVAVAMAGTAVAAWVAFMLARGVGRRWVAAHLERDSVRTVNERLSGGGTLGMVSLRLIPMIPFAPLNYCCGISAITPRHFLVGTLVGSLPGTAAVVVLGDALTGTTPPALMAVYAALAVVGAAGLYWVLRRQGLTPAP